ncbi:MAG: uracil-DNA glycosylase [Coxiella sp. (in: Bacteria)]|nr:MAG: uracil-DNA glycosylase [Coxiella sp. (in: g-proteobacteria)]
MTTTTLTWTDVLAGEKEKPYFKAILDFLNSEYSLGNVIYPEKKDIFNALKFTPFDDVKVVIIGQDPYHGPNQACGLCFSVNDGVRPPPSLLNIYKEMRTDVNLETPQHGNLIPWAEQGVLLLNTTLTVQAHNAGSHANIGWQQFTDQIITTLNEHTDGIVYLLWGAYAQSKAPLIDINKHHVLTTSHPSPLSAHRGFFGCQHFSKANEILKTMGRDPIDWSL